MNSEIMIDTGLRERIGQFLIFISNSKGQIIEQMEVIKEKEGVLAEIIGSMSSETLWQIRHGLGWYRTPDGLNLTEGAPLWVPVIGEMIESVLRERKEVRHVL